MKDSVYQQDFDQPQNVASLVQKSGLVYAILP